MGVAASACLAKPREEPPAEEDVAALLRADDECAAAAAAAELRAGEEWWRKLGGTELEPLLAHTTLVDARWLLELAEAKGVVPPWQKVPDA